MLQKLTGCSSFSRRLLASIHLTDIASARLRSRFNRRSVSRFVVPSFIYLVHNNVQFWTLRCRELTLPYMRKHKSAPAVLYPTRCNCFVFCACRYVDAPTYQIMGNLKIVTTGIFFRHVLMPPSFSR